MRLANWGRILVMKRNQNRHGITAGAPPPPSPPRVVAGADIAHTNTRRPCGLFVLAAYGRSSPAGARSARAAFRRPLIPPACRSGLVFRLVVGGGSPAPSRRNYSGESSKRGAPPPPEAPRAPSVVTGRRRTTAARRRGMIMAAGLFAFGCSCGGGRGRGRALTLPAFFPPCLPPSPLVQPCAFCPAFALQCPVDTPKQPRARIEKKQTTRQTGTETGGSPAPRIPPRLPLSLSRPMCSGGGGARALRCASLYPPSFSGNRPRLASSRRVRGWRCVATNAVRSCRGCRRFEHRWSGRVLPHCRAVYMSAAWGLRFRGAGPFIKAARVGLRGGAPPPRGCRVSASPRAPSLRSGRARRWLLAIIALF